jgi:hypothetical protein
MHRDRFLRVKRGGPPSDHKSVDELMIYGHGSNGRVGQVDHLDAAHDFAWLDDLYPDPYTIKRVRGCWLTYNGSLDGGGTVPAPRNYPMDSNPVLQAKMTAGSIIRMQFYHFAGADLFVTARVVVTKIGVVPTQRACHIFSNTGVVIHHNTITQLPWLGAIFQDGGTFWSSGAPTNIVIPEDGMYIATGWARWSFIAD